jgi:hypothetical protein
MSIDSPTASSEFNTRYHVDESESFFEMLFGNEGESILITNSPFQAKIGIDILFVPPRNQLSRSAIGSIVNHVRIRVDAGENRKAIAMFAVILKARRVPCNSSRADIFVL